MSNCDFDTYIIQDTKMGISFCDITYPPGVLSSFTSFVLSVLGRFVDVLVFALDEDEDEVLNLACLIAKT